MNSSGGSWTKCRRNKGEFKLLVLLILALLFLLRALHEWISVPVISTWKFPRAVPEGDIKSSSNSADKQTLSPRQLTCLHLLLQTLVNFTANNSKSDRILHVIQEAHAGMVSYLFHIHVYWWYIFSILILFLSNFCLANVYMTAYQWTVTWETFGVFSFACWRNRDWSQKSKDIFTMPSTLFYLTGIDAL